MKETLESVVSENSGARETLKWWQVMVEVFEFLMIEKLEGFECFTSGI